MKKLLLLLLCVLSLLSNESIAQGLIINENTFKWVNTLPTEEPSRSALQIRTSLEKYCPSVLNQSNTSMCVSFSLSTIRTIIYARNNNITDINQIDKNRFSPTFLYYLLKGQQDIDCKQGLGYDGVQFMIDYGLPFSSDVEENSFHPFSEKMICNYYPYSYNDIISDVIKGSRYVINEESVRLCGFSLGESKFAVSHPMVKSALFFGNPCLIGANFGDDFYKENKLGYNKLGGEESSMGHAMVIIGYDDEKFGGSYRVLNSYGDNWQDNGKTWIRYNDLDIIKGFIISMDGEDRGQTISEKEISSYLRNMKKEFLFKENGIADEIVEQDPLLEIINACKKQQAYLQSSVNLDAFCNCYVESLVNEMIRREGLGLDNSGEEWTQELLENCIDKNKRN